MTILLYHAVGPDGLNHVGEIRDKVIGKAGDHWSMQPHDAQPVKVYATIGTRDTLAECRDAKRSGQPWHQRDYELIWKDGQPWPTADGRGRGRPKR